MSTSGIRVVTTKLAKQVSGYTLILNDLEFSSRVFDLAAALPARTKEELFRDRPTAEERVRQLFMFDSVLRAGGGLAQFEADSRNDGETVKSALFEAGIVAYARCFNAGMRTRLSESIFAGKLLQGKKLHQAMISVRNKHIAHSELKMERSLAACSLVDDENYGRRPSLVMHTLAARRHFPKDERLADLKAHCDAIITHVISPKLLELATALREQLLQMPTEQFARFTELGAESPTIEELL